MNNVKIKDQSQRRLLDRRVIVESPVGRLDMIPKPTATEAVIRVRKQESGNVGANLRDLANALSGFGSAIGGLGSKASKSLKNLENACFGKSGKAKPLSKLDVVGSEELDLALVAHRDSEGKPPALGDKMQVGDGVVDVNAILQEERAQEKELDSLYKGLNKAAERGELVGRIDPRLQVSADQITIDNNLAGISSGIRTQLDQITDKDFDSVGLLNEFREKSYELYSNITDPRKKKAYLTKHLTQEASLASDINRHKVGLTNAYNTEVITGAAVDQLSSMSDLLDGDRAGDAIEDLPHAVRDTLGQFRKIGLGGDKLSKYYIDNIASPVVDRLVGTDPEKAQLILSSLGNTEMGVPGATLGKTKEYQRFYETTTRRLAKNLKAQSGLDTTEQIDYTNNFNRSLYYGDLDQAKEVLETLELDSNGNYGKIKGMRKALTKEVLYREKFDDGIRDHMKSLGGTLLEGVGIWARKYPEDVSRQVYIDVTREVTKVIKEYESRFKEAFSTYSDANSESPIKDSAESLQEYVKQQQDRLEQMFFQGAEQINTTPLGEFGNSNIKGR
jgi:hypothetical protein